MRGTKAKALRKQAMMTEIIETVAEFEDRFPDERGEDVIDHVEYVHSMKVTRGSITAMIILTAYNRGPTEAMRQYELLCK